MLELDKVGQGRRAYLPRVGTGWYARCTYLRLDLLGETGRAVKMSRYEYAEFNQRGRRACDWARRFGNVRRWTWPEFKGM